MGAHKRQRTVRSRVVRAAARAPAVSLAAVNQMPIITMDVSGTIQSASDDIESLFGWTPAEICGQNVKALIPEPKRSALDRYLDRYRNPGSAPSLERVRRFDGIRKDGSRVAIELSVSRADLPGHTQPYFVGLIRDLSGEIDVEADTPAARSRMQKFITKQTRALATAHLRLQLTDRMAILGTLAAGLGHDLNNMLLPLRARLVAMEHAGVSEAGKKHLLAIRHALNYMQNLTDGLHVLAIDPRGESDPSDDRDPMLLATWWTQVGGLLRAGVPKRIHIGATISPKLPAVRIASHWLTQAVLNILVNAGEAIPVSRKMGRIKMAATLANDGKWVRLTIRDNGRGMSRAVQKRSLDPFFTTKPRSLGTGLGLPLARNVVERAGGRLEVASTAGKGTSITLHLPVAPREGAASADRPSLERTCAVTVQDRELVAHATQMLAAAGFRIVQPRGAIQAQIGLWVTTPHGGALARATRWRAGGSKGRVVLLSSPPAKQRQEWARLGAVVLEADASLRTLRTLIEEEVAARASLKGKGRTKS